MKNKGINLSTSEFNNNLTKLVQESNLPPCVVSLCLQNVLRQIDGIYDNCVASEKKQYEESEVDDNAESVPENQLGE